MEIKRLFSLGWENSCRLKIVRSEYIGIDTTTLNSGVRFYRENIFFNIDSKAIGIFSVLDYKQGRIFVTAGTGISVSLVNEPNFKYINQNVILKPEYYNQFPGDDELVIFSNTGIFIEVGVGAVYQDFAINTNLLMELFKASLYQGQKISTSLIQVNIIYNF